MSEYQYYEFQALDRPLTPDEQEAVARLSSRVAPHPRRAVFIYHYSDFRGDAIKILAQYYDALFYIANWGTYRLAFRFPAELVDVDAMQQYTVATKEYPAKAVVASVVDDDYAILDIHIPEEGGLGWTEGKGWLDQMVGLREALIRRDYRVLYLAWLKAITVGPDYYSVDEDAVEPPVPSGLHALTPALATFVARFDVPRDLLAIAAERSPELETHNVDDAELRQRIAALPPEEKDDFLVRLAHDEVQLSLALRQHLGLLRMGPSAGDGARRTVGELLEAWKELSS